MPEKTQNSSSLSEKVSTKFAKDCDKKMKEEEILNLLKNYSKQFNTDFFVCVKDKDLGNLAVLSTDTKGFSFNKINSVFMKKSDDNVKDLKSISQIFDQQNSHSNCLSSFKSKASLDTNDSSIFVEDKLTQSFNDTTKIA